MKEWVENIDLKLFVTKEADNMDDTNKKTVDNNNTSHYYHTRFFP